MHLDDKVKAFAKLGLFMSQGSEAKEIPDIKGVNDYFFPDFKVALREAELHNPWFTPANLNHALKIWGDTLQEENLYQWLGAYPEAGQARPTVKTIALIMAGNLPLVGFHDMLSVLLAGHKALIKPSSDDAQLLPYLLQVLVAFEPRLASRIALADGTLKDFDAVIATGSDNSARYFSYYFDKYPHIIRKNRSSLAWLEGTETDEELALLADDIFLYFGLGCRSVSKLYLPKGYDLDRLFKAFYPYRALADHHKYGNNLDYYRAIYLMEQLPFHENGFVILKEEKEQLHAPTGVVYYEYYQEGSTAEDTLAPYRPDVQCVVNGPTSWRESVPFGASQQPALADYADGVDTLEFLFAQ